MKQRIEVATAILHDPQILLLDEPFNGTDPAQRLQMMNLLRRMVADYSILALSSDYHPMGLIRPHLHEGIVSTAHLEHLPDGTQVEVAGLVVCRQRPGTAKGFVFLVLEDEFGLVNVVAKPDLYERARALVRTEPFVIVRGELQRRDGTVNLIAESFRALQASDSPAPQAHNFG